MGIIIKPIVTEKMTVQGDKLNRYGFIVDRAANKIEIRKAVEEHYGVTVKDVNTVNYHGKRKSRYTKAQEVRRPQQHRQDDHALHRWRTQENVPYHRLPS